MVNDVDGGIIFTKSMFVSYFIYFFFSWEFLISVMQNSFVVESLAVIARAHCMSVRAACCFYLYESQ